MSDLLREIKAELYQTLSQEQINDLEADKEELRIFAEEMLEEFQGYQEDHEFFLTKQPTTEEPENQLSQQFTQLVDIISKGQIISRRTYRQHQVIIDNERFKIFSAEVWASQVQQGQYKPLKRLYMEVFVTLPPKLGSNFILFMACLLSLTFRIKKSKFLLEFKAEMFAFKFTEHFCQTLIELANVILGMKVTTGFCKRLIEKYGGQGWGNYECFMRRKRTQLTKNHEKNNSSKALNESSNPSNNSARSVQRQTDQLERFNVNQLSAALQEVSPKRVSQNVIKLIYHKDDQQKFLPSLSQRTSIKTKINFSNLKLNNQKNDHSEIATSPTIVHQDYRPEIKKIKIGVIRNHDFKRATSEDRPPFLQQMVDLSNSLDEMRLDYKLRFIKRCSSSQSPRRQFDIEEPYLKIQQDVEKMNSSVVEIPEQVKPLNYSIEQYIHNKLVVDKKDPEYDYFLKEKINFSSIRTGYKKEFRKLTQERTQEQLVRDLNQTLVQQRVAVLRKDHYNMIKNMIH